MLELRILRGVRVVCVELEELVLEDHLYPVMLKIIRPLVFCNLLADFALDLTQ